MVGDKGKEVAVNSSNGDYKFTFDMVFGPKSTQKSVFEYIGAPVVDEVFKGYNGTIFAYGQTSSGKTHTMSGPGGLAVDPKMRGIIPRAVDAIFDYCSEAEETLEFSVQVSFMEFISSASRTYSYTKQNNLPSVRTL